MFTHAEKKHFLETIYWWFHYCEKSLHMHGTRFCCKIESDRQGERKRKWEKVLRHFHPLTEWLTRSYIRIGHRFILEMWAGQPSEICFEFYFFPFFTLAYKLIDSFYQLENSNAPTENCWCSRVAPLTSPKLYFSTRSSFASWARSSWCRWWEWQVKSWSISTFRTFSVHLLWV